MRRDQINKIFSKGSFVLLFSIVAFCYQPNADGQETKNIQRFNRIGTVGAYYFDGWSGKSRWADDPGQPWAIDAPTHLTKRMVMEFPEREPIWGWRDDTPEIMERQIDLAADCGLSFFAFCWYWHADENGINKKAIQEDSKHVGLNLFLNAKNNTRLKFCLLVANHGGFEIQGTEQWKQASDFWLPYFTHPQYLTVGGKPLVIVFHPSGGDEVGFSYMQGKAHSVGLPGVAIAACGGDGRGMGYTHRTHYNIVPGYNAGSQEHKYSELVKVHEQAWQGSPELPYIPEITAGWDKRPWKGKAGLNQKPGWYFPDRTPVQFADFLCHALIWMHRHPEQTTAERIALIYAWNEFGEGGYIAPTKGDTKGRYLEAIKTVLNMKNLGRSQ